MPRWIGAAGQWGVVEEAYQGTPLVAAWVVAWDGPTAAAASTVGGKVVGARLGETLGEMLA